MNSPRRLCWLLGSWLLTANVALAQAPSESQGWPWRGRLAHPSHLPEGPRVRYVDQYRDNGHHYGTSELVNLISDVAARVAEAFPGSRLPVGELSAPHGGRIDRHRSHRSGRDVDIGFFALDAAGDDATTVRFARFGRSGTGLGPYRDLRFDDARNWAVVRALMESREARVQHIFVADTLKTRLLREAVRSGAPRELVVRAAATMMQPARVLPHRDHLHVRIYCPDDDRPTCRDRGPYWAWHGGAVPEGIVPREPPMTPWLSRLLGS